MESQYPIKPYKKPTKPLTTTKITMIGKMGKSIEVDYSNASPEMVTFSIKSNRGTVKDVLEIPIEKVLSLAKSITIDHDLFTRED